MKISALRFKNLTPSQLSLFIAIAVSLISFLVQLIVWFTLHPGYSFWVLFLVPGIIFTCAYFLSFYLIRIFVYRRITVLYKLVRSARKSPGQDTNPLLAKGDDDLISYVESEVSEWKKSHTEEMSQMKELENYRRDYMGNVAHELKTPIFNVQGFIDTLIDTEMQDQNINMRYLRLARQNIDRLSTILNDLDTISKLESNQVILDLQRFDIKDLVQEVFDDHEIMARNFGIELNFKQNTAKNYEVIADRESILQVLTNLVSNSIKYGTQGGKTLVSFYDMHHYILIEVMDSGIGIDQKHLKHVFDRFYRIDKGRSRATGGSGLGLSIVKHILESHGETITVRSTPGVGTTFSFTLKKAS